MQRLPRSSASTRLLSVVLAVAVIGHCAAILNNNNNNGNLRPSGGRPTSICRSAECKCRGAVIECDCGSTTSGEELAFVGSYKLYDSIDKLLVKNCRQVRIHAATFKDLTTLRRVELKDIGKIVLEAHSFSWKVNESLTLEANPTLGDNIGHIIVHIENSSVPSIPSFTFQGRIENLNFHKVQIGTVSPFAFSNLHHTLSIQFSETNITSLEAQAFKKFTVESITLSGGNYGTLPSRTMVDLEVTKLLAIEGATFNQVQSSAFIVKSPKVFRIDSCKFTRIEGDAFRIVTEGLIRIQDNVFVSLAVGAFVGITVSKQHYSQSGQQKLSFERNNLTHFENGSLVFNTTRLAPDLDAVFIEQPCSCASIKQWANQLIVYPPFTPQRRKQLADNSNAHSTKLSCRHDEKGKIHNQYINFKDYSRINCGAMTSGTHTLIIVIVGVSVLLLAIGVVVILCVYRRRRAQWINVPTKDKDGRSPKKNKGKNEAPEEKITMVVPDGRVYRETEFHVIVDQAEPIAAPEEHIYQNLKPKPLPRNIKQPVPQQRTEL